MHLLFVISSLNTGGAQRVLSNLVTNLPDDWEIDILLNSTENITYPYRGNLIDLQIREPSDRKSVTYQLKVLVKRFFALKKLKKNNYQACISFLESANVVNVLTGKKYCKTVLTVHNCLSLNKAITNLCLCRVLKLFYNRANRIVTVSNGVRHDLITNIGIHDNLITTIYNSFPVDDIRGQVKPQVSENNDKRTFTYISMGRCEQQKGQWHLIRAFAELIKNYGNIRLIILGDGSCISYYKQLINAYKIEDNVSIKGFVTNPYQELSACDALVFPSLWEGFGNVIIEAMACNLPVISSDYRYGAREILAPDTDINFEQKEKVELAEYGIITPVCSGKKHDAEEPLEPHERFLLEAMELIYNDETLRLHFSEASKRRANDFSAEKCKEQWCSLLN